MSRFRVGQVVFWSFLRHDGSRYSEYVSIKRIWGKHGATVIDHGGDIRAPLGELRPLTKCERGAEAKGASDAK